MGLALVTCTSRWPLVLAVSSTLLLHIYYHSGTASQPRYQILKITWMPSNLNLPRTN